MRVEAKKIIKKSHFYIDIYGINCHMIWSKEDNEIIEEYLNFDMRNQCGMATWYQDDNGSHYFFISVIDNDISTLVHEVSHTAHQIFKHLGMKADLDNDEPYAYLIGLLFRECMKKKPKDD